MKMWIWSVAAVAGLVLNYGCGTTAHVVDTQGSASRITTVNNVDPQDWETIVVAGVNDLLASGALAEYREIYGEKPLVMVSTIRNDSKQHLNTALLTERITEAILNSRQARVTSAVALDANVDKASKKLRELENDEDFDQSTVMQRGTLKSPNMSLSGDIIRQTATAGRNTESAFFFNMMLTDNKTGEVIWKYHKEIVKQETKPVFGW